MFTKKPDEPSKLQEVIDNLIEQMGNTPSDSKEYAQMADQLVKLYALLEKEKKDRVSKDTLALVTANIIGLLLVLHYERVNVITSKALGFIARVLR